MQHKFKTIKLSISKIKYCNLRTYLAVFSNGWLLPTNFLKCKATLAISSLSNHRRLRKDVGYPTSFSAADMARFQSFLLCAKLLLVVWLVLVANLSFRWAEMNMGRYCFFSSPVIGEAMLTDAPWWFEASRQRRVRRHAMRLSDIFVRIQ